MTKEEYEKKIDEQRAIIKNAEKEILIINNEYAQSISMFSVGEKIQINEGSKTRVGFVKEPYMKYGSLFTYRVYLIKKDGTAGDKEADFHYYDKPRKVQP